MGIAIHTGYSGSYFTQLLEVSGFRTRTVKKAYGRLLDNCQVSSLPHDCVAYRTRLRDHLKAFAGVLS